MTGLVRKATLLAVLGVLGASAAIAGTPASYTSEDQFGVPSNVIRIAGNRANQPDPGSLNGAQVGSYTDARAITIITVFDGGANRVPNSTVVIDFTNCTDMDLCATQPYHAVFTCTPPTVTAVTDANGEALFRIAGSFNSGPPIDGDTPFPGPGLNCATVTADTQALPPITAAGPDLNGAPGVAVNASDLSLLLGDLNRQSDPVPGASTRGRSNLNGSAELLPINAADLSILLQYLFDSNIPPAGVAGPSASCSPDC